MTFVIDAMISVIAPDAARRPDASGRTRMPNFPRVRV